MPPMTKIWLCTLKDPSSISSPKFQQLITELLEFCASYTNPTGDNSALPMHSFFQDTREPSQLFMITGYPSQEMNTEADNIYAERYLPRMFELVQHKVLRQISVDVRTLPLRGDIVLTVGKNPDEWKDEKAIGNWDYWPETRGIKIEEADKVYVQVDAWNGESLQSGNPVEGEVVYLRQIQSS
ncbi:hypothetical protein N7493_011014 [Penicillium malachiteum]|uniref:Uncharacterized protein n=1 Tax=Penicillium malachiteum TaxID=1324776 RepID=A0AAD6HBB9_9EURO|nr:hypothetical protein N7493_011014 [Penicillium malachiteum]